MSSFEGAVLEERFDEEQFLMSRDVFMNSSRAIMF